MKIQTCLKKMWLEQTILNITLNFKAFIVLIVLLIQFKPSPEHFLKMHLELFRFHHSICKMQCHRNDRFGIEMWVFTSLFYHLTWWPSFWPHKTQFQLDLEIMKINILIHGWIPFRHVEWLPHIAFPWIIRHPSIPYTKGRMRNCGMILRFKYKT